MLITDECFCEYTDHGHCGVLSEQGGRRDVDNDATLPLLVEQCLAHARAGADLVAPSCMLDGMIGAIRQGLDKAGFSWLPIMSYAAKYASGFYGPFRDAAESPPQFGDRSGYQMDPANGAEALREVALDLAEGADIVMVKPALAYLDVVRRVKDHFGVPLAAYNVSGEFAMVKAAAAKGWIDERRVALEILTSIKGGRRHDPDLFRPRRCPLAPNTIGGVRNSVAADLQVCRLLAPADLEVRRHRIPDSCWQGTTMLVGQQIGPFTVEREIGSGAMGSVYLARYKTGHAWP